MKNNHVNLVLCLLILTLLLMGCSAGTHVAGHVYDADNNPVQNATVKFEQVGNFSGDTSHQCIQQTWVDGKFRCGFLHAAFFAVPLRITVTKEGYKPSLTDFTSDEAHKKSKDQEEFTIVLEKE
jgi:hypothetical protein